MPNCVMSAERPSCVRMPPGAWDVEPPVAKSGPWSRTTIPRAPRCFLEAAWERLAPRHWSLRHEWCASAAREPSLRDRHQYQDQLSNSTTAYEIIKKGDGDPTKLITSIDGGRRSSNIDNSGGSSSTEFQSSYSAAVTSSFTNKPLISATSTDGFKIYCDLDGCLVNFEKGVQVLLNKPTSNLDKRTMWDQISQVPNWFEKLEWTMDGKRLWRSIQHLNPDILTGVPDIESSRVDKLNWCMRELDLNDANHVDMAAEGLEIVSMDTGLESSSSSNNNNDRNYWDDSNHGSSLWIDDHKSINGNLPRKDKTNIITCWSNNKYKECRIGS